MEELNVDAMIEEVNKEVKQLLESDNTEMAGIDDEIQAEVKSALNETKYGEENGKKEIE